MKPQQQDGKYHVPPVSLLQRPEQGCSYGTFNSSEKPPLATGSKYAAHHAKSGKSPSSCELESQMCFAGPLSSCGTLCGHAPSSTIQALSGSNARDNLSIERTFLTWLRTSMGLALVGFLLKLRDDGTLPYGPPASSYDSALSGPVSYLLIAVSVFVLVWALANYLQFQNLLAIRAPIVENGMCNFAVAFLVGTTIAMVLLLSIITSDTSPKRRRRLDDVGLLWWW